MTTSPQPQDLTSPAPGSRCPQCGWPDADIARVVSTHATSTGLIVYTRCACGALQVRHQRTVGQTRLLVRGSEPEPRPEPGQREEALPPVPCRG